MRENAAALAYEKLADPTVVHRGWLSVATKPYRLPDGSLKNFEVILSPPAVFVLAYHTSSDSFTLVREFYPGPGEWHIGLVAGLYEDEKHDDSLHAAKCELDEEARLQGGKWHSLVCNRGNCDEAPQGSGHPSRGVSTDVTAATTSLPMTVRESAEAESEEATLKRPRPMAYGKYSAQKLFPYLVVDPKPSLAPADRDPSEFLQVITVPYEEFESLVYCGSMTSPNTCCAAMGLKRLEFLQIRSPSRSCELTACVE